MGGFGKCKFLVQVIEISADVYIGAGSSNSKNLIGKTKSHKIRMNTNNWFFKTLKCGTNLLRILLKLSRINSGC